MYEPSPWLVRVPPLLALSVLPWTAVVPAGFGKVVPVTVSIRVMYGTQRVAFSPAGAGTSFATSALTLASVVSGSPERSATVKSTVTTPASSAAAPVILARTKNLPVANSPVDCR